MSPPRPSERLLRTADLETTLQHAAALEADDQNRRVNGEWPVIESLRHLVLVVNIWLSTAFLRGSGSIRSDRVAAELHAAETAEFVDRSEARPTFDEACPVLRGRLAAVTTYLDTLTEDDLERQTSAA